jgi:ADP-heptose:LPS heptosyltransferase/GT2 family glycosyltransferase
MSGTTTTADGRHLLVLAFDTFGDLLLRQPLLTSLLDRGCRVTLVARPAFARLAPYMDRRLEVFVSTIDPYSPGDEHRPGQVRELAGALRALSPDVVVCSPFNRTDVDEALLAAFDDRPRYGLLAASAGDSPLLAHPVAVEEWTSDATKNQALHAAITGDETALPPPRLDVPEPDREDARALLARLGLREKAFAIGAPAGSVTTALKAWPASEFADAIAHLHTRHRLPVLLVGVATERPHLEEVAHRANTLGATAHVWVGSEEHLGTLLGLVALSRIYLGSDTGPMHFAAALDVPVLARFGGGHWPRSGGRFEPRFLPRAARARIVTQKLPCFGCAWLCWLPEPECVRAVAPEAINRGLDELLEGGEGVAVDEGRTLDSWSARMIAEGAVRYRIVERERRAQRQPAAELAHLLAASEADRAARLEVIEDQNERLGALGRALSSMQERLGTAEAERAALVLTLEQMQRTQDALGAEVTTLRAQVGHLRSLKGSARAMAASTMRHLGLYDLAYRHRGSLNRYLPKLPGAAGLQPAAPPPASLPRPTLFEAVAVANAMGSAVHELAMERLYERGGELGHVLCVGGSREALVAAYMLAAGGATVRLLDAEIPRSLAIPGLQGDARPLGEWLASARPGWRETRGIVVGATDDDALRLFASRIAEGTRLWLLGDRLEWVAPDDLTPEAPGLHAFAGVPARWRDGRPRRLPSGRPWPRISVVTVTLNQAAFLEETLRSVLDQGYPDLEYIVLDGGSTDGTQAILERYRGRLAYCVSAPDRGQSDALNKGFARATGSILTWLNSDDAYPPDALWRAALAFDLYDADVVAGGCALVDDATGEVTRVHHSALPVGRAVPLPVERLLDIDGSWLRGDFFFQPEVFWTRALWERAGGRVAEELHYSMDYELWVRMALAGARIVHVPDTLARYRMHAAQKTSGADLPYVPELRRVAAGFEPIRTDR